MDTRKTQRKNKTKQMMIWPENTTYFTIDSLVELNPHMITSSGLDITLRVRLNKALTEENTVAVIGQKNMPKGRPQLVFAMKPISPAAVEKAKNDGINIDINRTTNVPVMNINGGLNNKENNVSTLNNMKNIVAQTIHKIGA